ncbi:hypothetical protein KI387_033523, partial [Taxus chinensis]
PTKEVKFEEKVLAKDDFVAIVEQEDLYSVFSECSFHDGTLFENIDDHIPSTQSAKDEEEQLL